MESFAKTQFEMIISQEILDELTESAKASPWLRMNMDLRNGPEEQSQRMLNALEPGTVMPIHRHHFLLGDSGHLVRKDLLALL